MHAADLHRLARALREIALLATENTGDERVNAGELAVLEDIARHPGTTIGETTRRTGLSQSLVSRIAHAMALGGAVTIATDSHDKRKTRIDLDPATRAQIIRRAGNGITAALSKYSSELTIPELTQLEQHLQEAERLLRAHAQRSNH